MGSIHLAFPPTRKRAQPLSHQSQHGAGDARREAPGQGAKLLSRPGGGGVQHRAGTHEELRAGKDLAVPEGRAAGLGTRGFNCKTFRMLCQSAGISSPCSKPERSGVEMLTDSLHGQPVGGEKLVGVFFAGGRGANFFL